jgi:hypothetical protein
MPSWRALYLWHFYKAKASFTSLNCFKLFKILVILIIIGIGLCELCIGSISGHHYNTFGNESLDISIKSFGTMFL